MQMDQSKYFSVCVYPQVEQNYLLYLATIESASSKRYHKEQKIRSKWESPNTLLPR